ncbi:hypothetical protein HG537_0G00410 [Torulaspora globosa]|uniref:Prefoldin alpha subunit n=1 Tax=Torulaspora globosa TaxID=48254 RepID=A0A7H9HY68_9SACH|nr:hypothetical protein HG537_0G00410 [Torulaspora sp. CBS 2947]
MSFIDPLLSEAYYSSYNKTTTHNRSGTSRTVQSCLHKPVRTALRNVWPPGPFTNVYSVDLTKLGPEQLSAVKQQFDQELQHFTQSLQALNMARSKFTECIQDIKSLSSPENTQQKLLVPASASLYLPGTVADNNKFMVDIGTGYYVDKTAEEAIVFYEKKVTKLNKEALQIQNIIKEKSQYSLAIEEKIRQASLNRHQELAKQQEAAGTAK